MQKLVIMKDHAAVTTSLRVAEVFEKKHKDVLKAIDNLEIDGEELRHQMFFEDTYPSRGKDYRLVVMNRDGFTLLAMGFTGKKATEFKLQYIKAFNEMENSLTEKAQLPQSPRDQLKLMYEFQEDTAKRVDEVADRVTEIEENTKIDASDYGYIGRRVNQRVKEIARGYNATNKDQLATLYKDINTGVKQITGVSTRSQLRQKDFDKVNEYINNWQPSTATITIINDLRDSA